MKPALPPGASFVRSARRLTKRHHARSIDPQVALELLADEAHRPALRTHKLKGKPAKSRAGAAACDVRIVFQFAEHRSQPAILLEAVGTHRRSRSILDGAVAAAATS